MSLTLRVSKNGAVITIEGSSVAAVLALEALFEILRDNGSIVIRPDSRSGGNPPRGGGGGTRSATWDLGPSPRLTRDLGPSARTAAKRTAAKKAAAKTATKATARKATAKKVAAKKVAAKKAAGSRRVAR
jgi:hypothetical protein